MEELLHKIRVLYLLRKSVSNTYSSKEDAEKYHECMEIVNDIESQIIEFIDSGE